MEFFQRSLFQMLNQTPQRWKASAKVEQNLITTKHATNFFLAKTKINPEIAKFGMWKWQNKESLIERHPPRSPIRHFIRFFFFFSTNQAIPPYTRATLRKTAKTTKSTIAIIWKRKDQKPKVHIIYNRSKRQQTKRKSYKKRRKG